VPPGLEAETSPGAGSDEPVPDDAGPTSTSHARRGTPWLVLPALVLLVLGLSALAHRTPLPPAAGGAGFHPAARLAYVTTGLGGGPGSHLYFADGAGRAGILQAGGRSPVTSQFEWSPDGQHAMVVDVRSRLHILPEDRLFDGPVRAAAFSPNGQLVAACAQSGWPPRIFVFPVTAPDHLLRHQGVAGCDPRWSADDAYLVYRIPDPPPGTQLDPARIQVWSIRVNRTFTLPGRWPATWAPGLGYAIAPLTVVSIAGNEVEIVDPRGGRRRTLVSAATILGFTGGIEPGPIVMLAWSPLGDRLAIGFAPGAQGLAGVLDIDPRTGIGTFVQSRLFPVTLAWSRHDDLLAAFSGVDSAATGFIWEVDMIRAGRLTRLPGMSNASWSPDGRWILARDAHRWVALEASSPQVRRAVGADSSGWIAARWCCPSSSVVQLSEGQSG
jgi:hypothetical protein